MLTEAEIEAYSRDGYVVPARFRLESGELETLRSAVEQVLRDNPNAEPDRIINPHLDRGRPYRLRGNRTFHAIAHDSRVLDMAGAVMGPDLVLLFTHLFCKTPRSRRTVPWHQDGPFWPIEPMASCTVWLALDKVDAGNGAMRVIPGSHREPFRRHELVDDPDSTLNREIGLQDFDESTARTIELELGQVSVDRCLYTISGSSTARPPTAPGAAGPDSPCATCRRRAASTGASRMRRQTGETCQWSWSAAGTAIRAPTSRWGISAKPGRQPENPRGTAARGQYSAGSRLGLVPPCRARPVSVSGG